MHSKDLKEQGQVNQQNRMKSSEVLKGSRQFRITAESLI